jgi:hypothetical protein
MFESKLFGGQNADQYNAVMTALVLAAGAESETDNDKIYDFLKLPKTSLVAELTDALIENGYQIIKTKKQ